MQQTNAKQALIKDIRLVIRAKRSFQPKGQATNEAQTQRHVWAKQNWITKRHSQSGVSKCMLIT